MGNLWQDVRYALRSMRQAPVFTAIVIGTLALAIGANAAIFTVTDAVMLRPFPYPHMERIVALAETTRAGQIMSVAWPNFQDWLAQNQVFEHLGLYRGAAVNLDRRRSAGAAQRQRWCRPACSAPRASRRMPGRAFARGRSAGRGRAWP